VPCGCHLTSRRLPPAVPPGGAVPSPGKSRYRKLMHCQIVCRLDTNTALPYGLAQGKWKSQASACS